MKGTILFNALREAIDEEMARDPLVCVMGEVELIESESIGDQVMKNVGDFSGPSASSMLLEQMKQDAVMKAGGGIMDINEMIRPIGK